MKIKRIEHVAAAVENLELVCRRLETALGLELHAVEDFGIAELAMYRIGESSLELVQGKSPASRPSRVVAEKGAGFYHICLEVENIDGALEELRGKGVKLLDEVPRSGHGGSRIAFIDPQSMGGLLIELAELPSGPHH